MILNTAFLILTVGGQEELIDLGRPIEISNDSIGSIVMICEGDRMSQDILSRSVSCLQSFLQKHFNHIPVPMV